MTRRGPKPTWKVIDRGKVPDPAPNHIMYACMNCMREAELPVVGVALAQINSGLVFDSDEHAMPAVIECRKCRHSYELEP